MVTEMLIFCALIVPLPFTWRRRLFTFISESPIIAKLQYGMKVWRVAAWYKLHLTGLDNVHLHPDTVH